jgi:hypothetical protein
VTLSRNETKRLMDLVISAAVEDARDLLKRELDTMDRTEPEFCAGIIEHEHFLDFTSEQWLTFFSRIPNLLFTHEPKLMSKLSENQRQRLKF